MTLFFDAALPLVVTLTVTRQVPTFLPLTDVEQRTEAVQLTHSRFLFPSQRRRAMRQR